MKKIERLIAIVMMLLQKKIVPTSELSRIFNVSPRTIQRDMDTLSLSGIPIYSIRGSQGGYGLTEEYKFDKRLLTNDDVENILIALHGFEQLMITKEMKITIEKIKSMSMEKIDTNIGMSFYSFPGRKEIIKDVTLIREAIIKNRQITFNYTNQQGDVNIHTIEPYRLFLNETRWYVYGYDTSKKEFRMYKIVRMMSLEIQRIFVPKKEISYFEIEQYKQEMTAITLEINQNVVEQFIERYGKSTLKSINKSTYEINIDLPSNKFGYQFLAGFGQDIRLIKPQHYIDEFKEFLQKALNQYE